MDDVIGVLLAGGRSRRFGQHKAFAKLNGKWFWEYSLDAMKGITKGQLIISHPALYERFKETVDCPILIDDENVFGKGPLAGLYTAMKYETAEWYVVLSCDVPFIDKQIIRQLVFSRDKQVNAIIPKIENHIHPLIAVYHHSALKYIEKALQQKQYKMMCLLDQMNVKYVSEHGFEANHNAFCNINSQEDYLELIKHDKI